MSSAASSSSGSSSGDSGASALLSLLREQTVALSSLTSSHAALAVALHLHTLRRIPGAKCVAVGEEPKGEGEKALPSIPPNWSRSPDLFCFQYILPSSSARPAQRLLVKSLVLDRTLLLHAALQRADSGADEAASAVHSLELCADDFVNSDALPSRAADGSGDVDFDALYKDLPSLLALYERNVLSKVAPSEGGQKGAGQESRGGQPLPYAPAPSSGPSPDAERQPQRGGEGFDPLRIYRPQRGGPFAGDIDPLTGGPGGNLMGPQNFPGGPYSDGRGAPRPGVPGMAPRFDPYGPIPGVGNDPDFDEMLPPGPGGPLADIGGPLPRGPGGPRRGGMGGPGMGGLGGPRGGFGQGPFGGGGGFPGGRGFM